MIPDLDAWLPDPSIRVSHRRESDTPPEQLWEAAQSIRLCDTQMLGRLVRWRIPGIPAQTRFDELFRQPPFIVLEQGDGMLVSGLVGRIWTLRRDYPELASAEEFRRWSTGGTARVVLANWVAPGERRQGSLLSETRVAAIGMQGRMGVAAVRPLIRTFQHLVGSDAIAAAVRRAEQEQR